MGIKILIFLIVCSLAVLIMIHVVQLTQDSEIYHDTAESVYEKLMKEGVGVGFK